MTKSFYSWTTMEDKVFEQIVEDMAVPFKSKTAAYK